MDASAFTYVFLAGIDNSGPDHWQSIWYRKLPGSLWVEHADWSNPNRDAWVADLDAALASVGGPKLVIAHSIGGLLLAEWALEHEDDELEGALLIAVPDVQSKSFPKTATGFRSAFLNPMPCPAMMLASDNDPYADLSYSRRLASYWRALLLDMGPIGHINADSGLGEWEEGWQIMQTMGEEEDDLLI
jgi:predicted alpha/beta hydrolase family esterase